MCPCCACCGLFRKGHANKPQEEPPYGPPNGQTATEIRPIIPKVTPKERNNDSPNSANPSPAHNPQQLVINGDVVQINEDSRHIKPVDIKSITVIDQSGNEHHMTASISESVESLKMKIQEVLDISWAQYTLNHDGTTLKDSGTLSEYQLDQSATIKLQIKPIIQRLPEFSISFYPPNKITIENPIKEIVDLVKRSVAMGSSNQFQVLGQKTEENKCHLEFTGEPFKESSSSQKELLVKNVGLEILRQSRAAGYEFVESEKNSLIWYFQRVTRKITDPMVCVSFTSKGLQLIGGDKSIERETRSVIDEFYKVNSLDQSTQGFRFIQWMFDWGIQRNTFDMALIDRLNVVGYREYAHGGISGTDENRYFVKGQ